MKKLDLRLFRMIKSTKGQYFAVLSIIITGIFVFTAVNNSAVNLKDSINDYYDAINFADIFIQGRNMPEGLEKQLRGSNDIKEAEARLVFDTKFLTGNNDDNVNVRVVSVHRHENKINRLFMKSGKRTLTGNDIIVIEKFAEARNIKVNDEIKLRINGREHAFIVSGIASSAEYIYIMENEQALVPAPEKFGVVYVEKEYLQRISGNKGNFNDIVIKLNTPDATDAASKYLENRLDKYDARIIKREDQLSNNVMNQEISGLELMSQSIPFIFLLFAGVMLAVMLSRIVKRDRMAIGVLKAMGFTNNEIVIHYLKYAGSVGLIGGTTGSIIGTALSGVMTNYYLVFFSIPMLVVQVYYRKIIVSIALSLVFCVIAGFWGVKDILEINPAESMKPESPKKGKRIVIEKIKIIWNHISFSWKLVLRSIFREKKKFIFIGAAVAITCGMMIMTIWMIDIVDMMFNRYYGEFVNIQYNISFDGFKSENSSREFTKLINVKEMEQRIEMPFEIKNGRDSKIVNVIGLENNTKFYSLKVPEDGILLSSNLATTLNVEVGEEVILKSLIRDEDYIYVYVKGIVNQALGINIYTNIDFLRDKFLDKGIINGIYINSDDNVVDKLKDIKDITVLSQYDMKDAFSEFTAMTSAAMGVMVIFSGLLGFIITYSMTLMSINERALEFSSLRVMGFTKGEIFNMLIRENMIMSVIGILFGIPIGLWLVNYMGVSFTTDLYTMKEPVTVSGIGMSIILTIIFIILAQLMTYVKIHKLDFMQALKNRVS
ncbi:FtsX-like permease family protein [Sedimentibacter sp.]|uniref:ABC transporter permease n=1 Tax=Sedimentibacter sp. TaxID=1960295 RepID=UPI0028973C44|nr:FtsX-like permease family protein [Sedimentibacter sp.]